MKKFTYPLLLLTALCCLTCSKKHVSATYESCCGAEATSDAVPMTITFTDDHGVMFDSTVTGRIYIPNIFLASETPADGDNLYMVFGNQWVKRIVSVEYSCSCGAVLFSRSNFLPNDTGYAWLGKNADGTLYKGSFLYTVTVEYSDGQVKTYTGKACAFQCGDEGFPDDNLPDCLFPGQNDGYGAPDQTKPQPNDCF